MRSKVIGDFLSVLAVTI